jgi:hypothetical protein
VTFGEDINTKEKNMDKVAAKEIRKKKRKEEKD